MGESTYQPLRDELVRVQLEARGIQNEQVLRAMAKVPRHRFADGPAEQAYEDHPVSIGFAQTMSQPYIVALMTELLGVGPSDRVLEVGTGSGYQAAVLAEIGVEVYTIEVVPELSETARGTWESLGIGPIHARVGDGSEGWPDAAPFDGVIVTAACPEVPPDLVKQLRPGARLVLPVGDEQQHLMVVTWTGRGVESRRVLPVRFVPLVGKARESRST